MTKLLEIERFRALADAYGAVISRWPIHEQEAAMLMARSPEAARILDEAARLDDMLDGWQAPRSSPMLAEQTLRSVSKAQDTAMRRLRIWWAGIGVAAALSGAAAGSLGAASISPGDPQTYSATLFGDVSDQED